MVELSSSTREQLEKTIDRSIKESLSSEITVKKLLVDIGVEPSVENSLIILIGQIMDKRALEEFDALQEELES